MRECVVGQIVKSTAGRDKDRFMIVIGLLDDSYALICDGDVRKLNGPKKKKLKHLAVTNTVVDDIAEKIKAGNKIQNAELRKILRPWNERSSADEMQKEV